MTEDKDQIRAMLANAVGNGIMNKKMAFIDTNEPTVAYYFPFSETAKKKEPKEGQVGV